MKNRQMKRRYILLGIGLMFGSSLCLHAQESTDSRIGQDVSSKEQGHKRAWEVGIGVTGLQLTRFSVINFQKNAQNGYSLGTNKKDLLFGGQLYLARELTSHWYLDLQGGLSHASDPVFGGKKKSRWIGLAGLGLQWRLGEYFNSRYIDPFLRIGANYMYKNFTVDYNGLTEYDSKQLGWNLANDYNKEGADHRHLLPVSVGAGVNMWLNDRLGIGLQGDYLIMPYRRVANSWQGAVRLIWRIGGKSKKPQPQIQYVEKVVERVVEKPVVIQQTPEEPEKVKMICELFENIYFDFDKADITPKSAEVIDQIVPIMKANADKRYLITGCTDARGSREYNQKLSERRAKAVVETLIEKGVPADILKFRGVGKKISYASEQSSHQVREGDRKILIEVISNMDYWNHIP